MHNKTNMGPEDVLRYALYYPQIVTGFDKVTYSPYNPNRDAKKGLLFEKQMPDGRYFAYDLVGNKRGQLTHIMVYMDSADYNKRRDGHTPMSMPQEAVDLTSETLGSTIPSDASIPNFEEKVKNGAKLLG